MMNRRSFLASVTAIIVAPKVPAANVISAGTPMSISVTFDPTVTLTEHWIAHSAYQAICADEGTLYWLRKYYPNGINVKVIGNEIVGVSDDVPGWWAFVGREVPK